MAKKKKKTLKKLTLGTFLVSSGQDSMLPMHGARV